MCGDLTIRLSFFRSHLAPSSYPQLHVVGFRLNDTFPFVAVVGSSSAPTGNVRGGSRTLPKLSYISVCPYENGQDVPRLDLEKIVVGVVSGHYFGCVLHQGMFEEKGHLGRRWVQCIILLYGCADHKGRHLLSSFRLSVVGVDTR